MNCVKNLVCESLKDYCTRCFKYNEMDKIKNI